MTDYYRYDARDDFDGRRRGRGAPNRYTETVYVRGRGVATPTRQMELIRRPESEVDASLEVDYAARPTYDRRVSRSLDRNGQANAFAYGARYADDPRGSDDVRRSRRPRRPRSRGRSLSRTQELAAAAAGAGLALGGQELWNRRDGKKKRHRSKSRLGQVAVGLAGAAAGDLAAKEFVKDRERRRRHDGYDADDTDGDDDRPRRDKHRRKSLVEVGEAALEVLGLGAAADSHHDRDRDRDYDRARDRGRGRYDDDDDDDGGRRRHRHSSSDASYYASRSRSRPRGGSMDRNKRLQEAAQAAIAARPPRAGRGRKEAGGILEGAKARRILTAAVGAGGIDALVDKDPDRHGGRHVGEGAIGGLLLNQFVNGSRGGRRRSRSGSRSAGGTLKDIAAAGVAAGVGKKILDRPRSPSRSRHRRRYSSDASSVDDRRPRRSKSVTDYIDEGMSKLGIGGRDKDRRRRDRDRDRDGGETGVRSSPYTDDERSQTERTISGGGLARDGTSRRRQGRRRRDNRNRSSSRSSSSSRSNGSESEFSLSEEERNRRKMKGKEYLTAGLATVATVHAAHEIYESMEKRKKRLEAVRTGKLSPTRAKSMKRKAQMKDAAALALAGFGLKGVADSWKETHHQRRECREFETKLERHRRIAAEKRARNQQGGGADGVGGGMTSASPSVGQPRRRKSFTGPVYDSGNPYGSWRE